MKLKGFTLLEILFSIAILGILVTIVTFSFSKLNSQQELENSTDLVVTILNEARSLTLSSKNDSQYGVYLDTSKVVLFEGISYSPTDATNVTTVLNSLVGIRNISLINGGASIVFKRLTGDTNETGSFEIYLINKPETFNTVNISSTGTSDIN